MKDEKNQKKVAAGRHVKTDVHVSSLSSSATSPKRSPRKRVGHAADGHTISGTSRLRQAAAASRKAASQNRAGTAVSARKAKPTKRKVAGSSRKVAAPTHKAAVSQNLPSHKSAVLLRGGALQARGAHEAVDQACKASDSPRKAAPASRKRMLQTQANVAASARKSAPQTRKSVHQARVVRETTPRARARSVGKPRKMMILLVSAALVLVVGVGGVYAWITLQTPEIENSFTPGTISCQVQETFDGTTKSDVRIKNTGDQPEYMRATIVVNWVDGSGNVNAQQPVLDTDYTLALGSAWTQGSDGFYYYNTAVSPGQATPKLITSAQQIAAGPSGYTLNIDVLAECIQAEPASARTEAWGV